MKLSVIALDYDGTIARNDVLDPSVREAIAEVRTRGITVMLVTGRILDELRRVAGDLHFVDAVIAENGAVIHFPQSGRTSTLAPLVPAAFVTELRRRGIRCSVGQCLVDADATDAARLLEVIRSLEVPLVLIFNAGRVMALAQGISKATGFRVALDSLRLSPHNALAIGDAENDHELLRASEVGVAVEWASPALRSSADIVLTGNDLRSVASYLRTLAGTRALPAPARPRRRLILGHTEEGREFALAVRGRNVLVTGDAKSGKSWVAGLLSEQLILLGYCLCVIDPEGDYSSLEGLPGVTVLGRDDPPPTPRDLLRALRYPDRSVVVDLSHQPHDQKTPYIRALLPTLNVLRRRTGLPHRVLLDEAHYYLSDTDANQLLDFEHNSYTIVTYRASQLPKELLDRTGVVIVTCESNPAEVEALRQRCAGCRTEAVSWTMLGRLEVGQAVALPMTDESGGELRLFTLAPRLTPHVRHRQKYVDVPVSYQRAFIFSLNSGASERRARTLRQFVTALEASPVPVIDGHTRRGDFSRWIDGVFGDHALGEELRRIEERHRVDPRDTVPEMVSAIRARYDLTDDDVPR